MLPDPLSPDATRHVIDVVPMNFREEFKQKGNDYVPVHKFDLVKKGSPNHATTTSVNEAKRNAMLWEYVEPYYERWLKKQEDPVDGTPIDVLPFLSPSQVDHLKHINIRTAEDLASTTESTMERIGMGARRLREKAQAFLDAKGGADLAKANAELKAETERMQQEISELRALVNTLTPPDRRKRKNDA